jgi:hypothetical protein
MSKHIDNETAEKWAKAAALWRQASKDIEAVRVILLCELGQTEGKPIQVTETALEALNGQSYMFTPQTEWMGGDSHLDKNFKFRKPHILNDTNPVTDHADLKDGENV